MDPFISQANLSTGIIEGATSHWIRRLKDMNFMYQDQETVTRVLNSGNPVIYEVYEVSVPEQSGQLAHGITIIHPGKIGNEFYMTKGHYHEKRDTAEVYFGLSGQGYLLLQTETGKYKSLEMKAGTAAYVPPYWAHRTVNLGDEPFIFYAVYPGDAGHDYGTIESVGFPQLILEEDSQVVIKKNPNFQRPG